MYKTITIVVKKPGMLPTTKALWSGVVIGTIWGASVLYSVLYFGGYLNIWS